MELREVPRLAGGGHRRALPAADRARVRRGRGGHRGRPAQLTAPLEPVRLTDPADPRVADYRDLTDAELRRRIETEGEIFVVEGRLPVERLAAHHRAPTATYEVASLLVADNQTATMAPVIDALLATGVPVYVATREVLAATVGFNLHRGVVAIARRPSTLTPAAIVKAAGLIAVLEGINDPENLGTIFRAAAAFGIAGVLLDPTTADPLYRRSVRVSVGHVLDVPFARLDDGPAGMAELRAAGLVIAALSPHRGTLFPKELPPPGTPLALVIGAEGPGLRPETVAAADFTVAIPMAPGVDSLNVGAAAAIAFHQLSGQGLDVGR